MTHPPGPQHPSVAAIEPHWHKIVALLMLQQRTRELTIARTTLDRARAQELTVAVEFDDERGVVLRLLNAAEAASLIESGRTAQ